ncbi:MAG: hypothetical protein ABII00_15480, partial [Elusimicrobiota bacterium]
MKLIALILYASAALPAPACAAGVLWSGQGDGTSWSDAANWTPVGVPGPSDDVSVSSSGVILSGTVATLEVNSLTLGDGSAAPRLALSTGAVVAGTLTIKASAVLRFDAEAAVSGGTVTVESGGAITHTGPVQSSTVSARFDVAVFDLRGGAQVDLAGKGYAGGAALAVGAGPGGGGAGGGPGGV